MLLNLRNNEILRLTLGAVLISTSAPWVRIAEVAPTTAGFYRMLIGGVCLLIICIHQKQQVLGGLRYTFALLPAALFFALDLSFWHRSIHSVGPGLATMLANLQVFFLTAIGLLFFNERLSSLFVFGLSIAFSGVFLLVGLDWSEVNSDYRKGVTFGVMTAVCYTGFLLSMRNNQNIVNSLSPVANLAVMSLLCAALLGCFVLYEGNSFAIPTIKSALSLMALGVCCQVFGWLLITTAMPSLPASLVGLILLLQPALSMLWDDLFFSRHTTFFDILGSIMVLAGIYLATRVRADTIEPKQ